MKNINKYIVLFLFSIVLLFSCEKEAKILDNFEFTLTETHIEDITINVKSKATFTIETDRIIESNTYQFKYKLIEGSGVFYDFDDNLIDPDEYIELSSLKTDFYYSSASVDVNKILVTVKDSNDNIKTIELNYKVVHNEFSIEASTPTNDIGINTAVPLTINLFNNGVDNSVTYEIAHFITQGTGELLSVDETQVIPLEEFNTLQEGSLNYKIRFSEVGESTFKVTVKDSNGQTITAELIFNVNPVNYSFTAEPERNSTFLSEDLKINMLVTEDQGSGENYTLRYRINSGEVTIKDGNSNVILPNTPVDITTETPFFWIANSSIEQTVSLTFFTKNDSGLELSQDVSIVITGGNFIFSATPTATEANVNDSISINGIISENGGDGQPYVIQYTTTGSGELTYNGQTYTPGDEITIIGLTSVFNYKGLSDGTHDIIFTVKSNTNVTATDAITLTFNRTDFEFTAVPEITSAFINDCTNINFLLNTLGTTNPTYTMTFTSDVAGQFVYNGNSYNTNVPIVVTDSQFTGCFRGTEEGLTNLTFTVTSSTGITKNVVTDLTITGGTFEYTTTPTASEANIGDNITINGIITETGPSGSPYVLQFTTTGTGQVIYEGTTYSAGEEITLSGLTQALQYTGNSIGVHTINFTLTSDYNVIRTETETLEFTQANFEFTAVPEKSSEFVNECTNVNFRINTIGNTAPTYTMVFTSDVAGQFIYNGTSYNTNIPISVENGEFTGCFRATEGGVSNLTFIVTSSTGLTKNVTVNLTIIEFDYTFTVPETLNAIAGFPGNFIMNYQSSNPDVVGNIFYTIDDNISNIKLQSDGSILQNPLELSIGEVPLNFDYQAVRNYNINWTYTNSLGYNDSYTTTVIVEHYPYNVVINGNVNIDFGLDIPLDLVITADQSIQNYSIQNVVISDSNIVLKDQGGSNVVNGYDLLFGTNSFIASNYSESSFTISFDIVDEYGQVKSTSKTFTIIPPNVSLTNPGGSGSGNGINCGTQAGEQKQYRIWSRALNLRNDSSAIVNEVEVYSADGNSLLETFTQNILPGTEPIVYTARCTGPCSLSQSICEPGTDFQYRYKIGDVWSEKEAVSF